MTTYQPIPPAATLPANGKASQLRIYNTETKDDGGVGYTAMNFSQNAFNLTVQNGGSFIINTPLKVKSTVAETLNQVKSFFEWLGVYKQQAVDEAKVFVDDEKTRAEGAESNLQAFIDDETGRATGAESALQTGIDDEKSRAEGAEAGLQSQISNLLSNTDAVALNSLAELVQEFSTNGSTITTALDAEKTFARAEAADLRTRVAALETLVASLVNSSA